MERKPVLHFVYIGDPHDKKIISAPGTKTINLFEFFCSKGITVKHYKPDDKTTIPDVRNGDVVIGHPHHDHDTIIYRLFDSKCAKKCLLWPFHTQLPQFNRYAKDLAAAADKLFVVSGPYWIETIARSEYADWAPKVVRVDNAIDAKVFALRKNKFNPPGKRGLFVFGRSGPEKGVTELFGLLKKTDYPVIIAGSYKPEDLRIISDRPNTKILGQINWLNEQQTQCIFETCDFFVGMPVSDASPTTMLESMAVGLITITTPQCGYYYPSFLMLSLKDIEHNLLTLQQAQYINENELIQRQRQSRAIIEQIHSWQRFGNTIWEHIGDNFNTPPNTAGHKQTTRPAGAGPKVAEYYINDGIKVDTHSSFGRNIKELFARITPQKIIETGTYLGTGTTAIIADTLTGLGIRDTVFYTIEVNPEYYSKAKKYFSDNNLKVYALNGLSIPRSMLLSRNEITRKTITEAKYSSIFVDHPEQKRAELYHRETDFPNVPDNLLYKCLKNFDFKPDFVLLDSAGHLGNIEFDCLIENLKGECYIALDDIYHIKHHRDFLKMQSDERFEIVVQSEEKFGFCIARFNPLGIQTGRQSRKKILIIRPDAIGDFVLFAGTLKYYRRLFDNTDTKRSEGPASEIHLFLKKHVAELAKNCPDVDCLIEFDAKMLEEDESYSSRLFSHLKEQKYDVAIYPVYSRSPQGDLLTLESGAAKTIAFDGNNSNIADSVKICNDEKYTRLVPTSKEWSLEIKRSEEMVRALGIGPDEPVTPKIWLTDEDDQAARQLLTQMKIEDPIIFCPFAQHAIRHWPVDNWAKVLAKYEQFPVLICGSADNHKEAEQIIKLSGHPRAFNLCGKTGLRELAALLTKSKLCIGVESAAGHIAAAAGCPHVILIGGGHFGRFMPYSPLTTLVYAPMECYRCNWACKFEQSRCITQIRVESVDKAIQHRLKTPKESITEPVLIKEELNKDSSIEALKDGTAATINPSPARPAVPVLKAFKKDAIVIATSIAPKEIDKQVKAINSWHKLGFEVISVNNPDEIEILREHFPLVNFVEAKRNAKELLGKPYIYIDDILEQLKTAGCNICGIVNSDIFLVANENTLSVIRKEAENSFVYGSRVEVDSLDNLNGELYDRGFDFFFFDKSLIELFPKSDFCIGATWWDYWLPLVSILTQCRTRMFVTPFAAHVRHRYKWDEKQWHLLAEKIYNYITEKIREKSPPNSEVSPKADASAPLPDCLDLAARMISAHTYFIIKRQGKVRNKDEYRKILCQSCGKAVLEFLKTESQIIGQADGRKTTDINTEIYQDRDNTLGISFDDYHKAVELNRLGETLIKRGDTEKALGVFEQAVGIVPNLTAAYNNIGALLSKSNPTAALKHFMKALKVDAAYIPAVNNTAELLLHSGKAEMARNFVLGSAQICLNFGMPAKAIKIYKAYMQLWPGDAEIANTLKKLEALDSVEKDFVPLVFVNWGDGWHLKYALAQARIFNRLSKIYLIGDQTNDKYDFVEHYDYTQFNSSAQQFAPLYKHLSPNPYDFELGCFLRWFIIRDFLKKMNLTRCVALDSDVMAYACLSDHWHRFANFGMTVSDSVSPHCNFISDVDLLSEFCDFIIQSYSDPACIRQMEDFFESQRRKGLHGISDMTFFEKFRKKYPDRIGEIAKIFYGTKFDVNINYAEGEGVFQIEDGLKKICWQANSPQGKLAATGDLVAFEILHFQGPAKAAIKKYFMGQLLLSPQGKWNIRKDGDLPYIAQMDTDTTIDDITNVPVPRRDEPKCLVSTIVSTYNSEKFIRGCLEDLENQTIADKIEIIVVDSASQQDEEAIVRAFQKRYDNIVYIKTDKREGLYSSWNRAINAARGQFLTSANTDDRHRRDALEIMANTLLENPDVALVYSDQFVTDTPNPTFENHNLIKTAQQPEFSRERLLFGCCVGSQPMWRKSLHDEFGGFDETLTCAADWDFWLKVSSKYCFKHIPQVLGLYYQNPEGIEHGRKIHSLYERYLVGKRYGNPYISIIEPFTTADNPLISIWMAAYNAQDYITEAIESVLIQNYRNFELLIVDDGSTDRTADIVRGFKDERIKYFLKKHGGLASARNVQLRKSNGSFIVILDSDDLMTPDFLARHLLEFQQHPEADLVYCDDLLINQDNKPIRVINRPEYQDVKMLIPDLFRCGFPVVPFRTCIRKSVFDEIGHYDEQLLVAEDYDMLRRFIRQDFKIRHLPAALYLRRVSTKSHSRNFDAVRAKSQLEAVRRFTDTFTPEQLFPDVRWNEMPASQKLLLAKCRAAGVYMNIGAQYLKTNITNYASAGFELGCTELDQCCKLEPANQQIRTLMEQCRSIRDERLATDCPVYQQV
jgi:glycosyltransferase involved in cell wall biosynthesis/ADP-heptose:LPS heptosyltransferase/tetratricopeptide (TPR) repeat protein